jgi:hypothetical protein
MSSPCLRFHELRGAPSLLLHRAPRHSRCVRGALSRAEARTAAVFLQRRPEEQRLEQAAAAVLLPALLHLSLLASPSAAAVQLTAEQPLYDGAKIVSSELRPKLSHKLTDFEE